MSNQDPSLPPDKKDPSSRNQDGKKSERPSSNLFWLFLLGGTVLMLVYSFVNTRTRGEEITFSKFKRELRDNVLDGSNVYQLKINPGYITYQDHPDAKSGETSDTSNTNSRSHPVSCSR